MNSTGFARSRLVLPLFGMGYLGVLAIGLTWWHLPPEAVLALTVGAAALVLLTLRPYLGVHAFVALLFFENMISPSEGLTVMKVLGAIIIGGWLLSMAVRRGAGLRVGAFLTALVLFLTWMVVSLVYALDTEVGTVRAFTFAQLALAGLMFSSVVDTTAKVRGVYWAFVLWTWASTVIAVAQYYLGITSVAAGTLGNRNSLAGAIDVAIVCAYLLYQGMSHRGGRLALALSLPFFFLGLALTFSRSGLIVLCITLALVWYRVAMEKNFLILAVTLGVLCIVTLILPAAFWTRATSIVPAIERQQDTFGMRVSLWKVGLRMIEDRPLVGVGPGNFMVAFPRYGRGEMRVRSHVAHNTYIGMAAEMGLVGLATYLLLWLTALREARRAVWVGKRWGPADLRFLGVATEVNLIGMMIAGLSGNMEGVKSIWMFLGIAVALGGLAVERGAEASRPMREESRGLVRGEAAPAGAVR